MRAQTERVAVGHLSVRPRGRVHVGRRESAGARDRLLQSARANDGTIGRATDRVRADDCRLYQQYVAGGGERTLLGFLPPPSRCVSLFVSIFLRFLRLKPEVSAYLVDRFFSTKEKLGDFSEIFSSD